MKFWRSIEKLIPIGIYIGFLLILLVCMYGKKNLHTDEVSTYVLSNNTYDTSITVNPERNVTYEEPQEVWLQSMVVQEGQEFNYRNVWEKQSQDVHPPLYYALIHTICSVFAGTYSQWYAAGINILFAMLTLFVLRMLAKELTAQKEIVFLVSCFFMISSGVLSATTFLRMYIMAMFFTVLVSLLLVKGLKKRNPLFYVALFAVSVVGALTHYYYIVYLFFVCLFFGIYLLYKRQWGAAVCFVLTMCLAGGASVAIFPDMLAHSLGGGYRGEETLQNLAELSPMVFFSRLKTCYTIVDVQLFGGFFIVFVTVAAILTYIGRKREWKKAFRAFPIENESQDEVKYAWIMLSGSCLGYFLVITKAAVYTTDRYFHIIYPLLILLVVCGLCVGVRYFLSIKVTFWLIAVVLLLTTVKEFGNNWFYLYRSTQSLLETAKQYGDLDCIYIVNAGYEINPSFYEIREYDTVTFIDKNELDALKELDLDVENGLIVSMGNAISIEEVAKTVQDRFPKLINYEQLGGHSFSVTYRFYE